MKLKLFAMNDDASSPTFSSLRRVSLLLLLCVIAEFAIATWYFGSVGWSSERGDEPGYRVLATNLLDRGVLSLSEQGPFEPSVFRAPGYPLFVAAAYLVSGRSAMFLRLVQFLLLGLTGVLLYCLSRRMVGPKVSALAGLFCVTYPPFVFQATYLLTETLATFLAVLFVYLTALVFQQTTRPRAIAFGLGVTAGYAALVRPSLALLVAGPILALIWSSFRTGRWKRQTVIAGLVALGYVLVISPSAIRNATVAREFIPFGSAGGWSFYHSMRQYAGTTSYQIPLEEWDEVIREYDTRLATAQAALADVQVSPGASRAALVDVLVDRAFTRDGLQILRGLTIGDLISGIPARLLFLWSTADASPWADGGFFHRLVQLLHLAIVILVLCGCYVMRGTLLRCWQLWTISAYLVAIHLVFHVEPRYSFPGRPFLLVIAALAVARLASMVASSRRVRGIATDEPIEAAR